ncbi:hypothetical protein [Plasmodium yoelii yoelii]|uniref:Uncharacterized protein n=1 Tax=Plasmodium yoelii yoelii TaxID=73239 RepID=Q7RQN3_PLAYO|nr:hypothetical protein [Plasmodium yoelii yoelii]
MPKLGMSNCYTTTLCYHAIPPHYATTLYHHTMLPRYTTTLCYHAIPPHYTILKICDALDILLKLIILYKDKCLNIEKDVMKVLQIFTVHSKNKNVTFYCLKIFANIQKFCPNLYKGIDNDDIAYYLKSKVDEFIEKWPNYNESSNDIQEHVNEFQNSVEEILKVKNKIENAEIHKINEDYINNQIACTSISKNLNSTINGNNYSKTKELFHILESKNNEKSDGSNTYENSMIYFRFVYLASFLYSDNVETISKVTVKAA